MASSLAGPHSSIFVMAVDIEVESASYVLHWQGLIVLYFLRLWTLK